MRNKHLASFPGTATREQVIAAYQRTFGRNPECVISPNESGTSEWWLGWASAAEHKNHEQFKTLEIIRKVKGPK